LIQHHPKHPGASLHKELSGLPDCALTSLAELDHVDHAIDFRGQDLGVGGSEARRAVENDHVCAALEVLMHVAHGLRIEQLRGIRREGPGCKQSKPRDGSILKRLVHGKLAEHYVAKSWT